MRVPEKKGYEVIRFIERSKKCYTSIDFVKGTTLYNWINQNGRLDKAKLQTWLQEILRQLVLFHKQHENPDYQFLNPYNIIITGKDNIMLRSVEEAERNVDRFVEKYFTSQSEMQNQDVYCFGKTIQFIMAHVRCEPYLTKKEEYKLLKIVRKCLSLDSKSQYENIQEIQKNFVKEKRNKDKSFHVRFPEKWKVVPAVFIVIVAGILIWQKINQIPVENVDAVGEAVENIKESETEYFDIGLSYFLELCNYEKSRECFRKVEMDEVKAKYYVVLTEFMMKDSVDVEKSLQILKSLVAQEEKKDIRELLILIRTYALLDSEEAYQTIIELAKDVDLKNEWDSLGENIQKEFCEYRALAYEKLQFLDNAIVTYNTLFKIVKEEQEREQIYLKLIEIYTKMNDVKNVMETCKNGMEELTHSVEIYVRYVESLWLDRTLDEEERLKEIQWVVKKQPEIVNEESFVRLIRTKGIQLEGERGWIEE